MQKEKDVFQTSTRAAVRGSVERISGPSSRKITISSRRTPNRFGK